MRQTIAKYRMLCAAEWSVLVAYRSESVIWMVAAFVQPLVSMAVWLSVSGGGSIAGYAAGDYILYFVGVLVVERLTSSWDVWDLDKDIREGALSPKLLRPFHPIHWHIAQNLVYKSFFAMWMLPLWFLLALVFPTLAVKADGWMLAAAVVSILLSSALQFLIGFGMGLLAFWTNKAVSLYALYEGIHLFLAGRIAPLAMFPQGIAEAAYLLPFYATVGLPVDMLAGRLNANPALAAQGLAVQLFWLIVLLLVLRWQWRSGIKRYGAVGG